MLSDKLRAGASSAVTYVDDVFSTYLYTGNGSTQTITNGIDLAGRGGMVWIKGRSSGGTDHALYDTVRGSTFDVASNTAAAQTTQTTGLTGFSASGFSVGALAKVNTSTATYTSWTFRKAPKFFDVVTYTGNGSTQNISHSLGQVPGIIIIKRTDAVGDWSVWHKDASTLYLNSNGAALTNVFGTVTSSSFGITSISYMNAAGGSFVAYVFGHDTATDGIIQCGSFTTDGNGDATVNLGWEPQFVISKSSVGTTGAWFMNDIFRGSSATGNNSSNNLDSNTTDPEATNNTTRFVNVNSTGFNAIRVASTTHIYLAIRRPNKPPTTGTQVFTPVAWTGTGAAATVSAGFPTDMVIEGNRTTSTAGTKFGVWDRLRFVSDLFTNTTAAEVAAATTIIQANPWDSMTGLKVGTTSTLTNASTNTFAYWMFKRAPGFFDEVCYKGTGAATTFAHNLGVAPQLIIVKKRNTSSITGWLVGATTIGYTKKLYLNLTNASATDTTAWNSTAPTSTVFSVGTNNDLNESLETYVAYLFVTLSGISKVGSYTGNGSNQTINCGFTTGARFVMIKRTDSTGDWYVWDTARGIVAANDPHLSLNTTAAEVTTDDSVDADTTGFIVNQLAATNVNVTSATYLFLAIA